MSKIEHIYYNKELDNLIDQSNLYIQYDPRTKIEDVNNFIYQLRLSNLYSKELEEFIDNYLKFDNN